jgi:hypothetical protein
VRLALSLRGDTCGDVAVRSPLAWTTDGQAIHLEHAAIEEPERLAGFSLDPGALGRDLEGKLKVTPTIGPDALKEMLPALASALADPTMDVNATVSSAKPSRAFARGDDMVATIRLRGSVELRQR